MTPRYVIYSDDLESRAPDEEEVIGRIVAALQAGSGGAREGRAACPSHARGPRLIEGELHILPDLPPELRQGLFAAPRRHPVLARLAAAVPGGPLHEDGLPAPRGVAIKVFDVRGPRLPGRENEGEATQDFLLGTGAAFPVADAHAFLATLAALETASPAARAWAQPVSATSRASSAAPNAARLDSANLDFFGHPPFHPLAGACYSQTPLRYGDHVAKLRVAPVEARLRERADERPGGGGGGKDAPHGAVAAWLFAPPAEYEVAVQLCTDLDTMPVENASRVWPEDRSPYRAVARLVFPAQDAAGRHALEEILSFCPGHGLAAHRPLGSVNRARLRACDIMAALRRRDHAAATAGPPYNARALPRSPFTTVAS